MISLAEQGFFKKHWGKMAVGAGLGLAALTARDGDLPGTTKISGDHVSVPKMRTTGPVVPHKTVNPDLMTKTDTSVINKPVSASLKSKPAVMPKIAGDVPNKTPNPNLMAKRPNVPAVAQTTTQPVDKAPAVQSNYQKQRMEALKKRIQNQGGMTNVG